MTNFIAALSATTLICIQLFSSPACAATPAENLAKQKDALCATEAGKKALECILSWQTKHGDWPKNKDTTKKRFDGDRDELRGTFDNGATTGELKVLARAFNETNDSRFKQAFLAGFDHIIQAQYPSGGWPQYYPLRKGYYSRITFNDDCMIRIMSFLHEVDRSDDYAFVGNQRRAAARKAVEAGIACILKCQIIVDGKRTVWCAQHDENTLEPANARSYELASLSGSESAKVLRFLMKIPEPSPDLIRCIESGVAWFQNSKIEGYRYEKNENGPPLVAEPNAKPLWARFYEIDSNRPFFCDRDGIPKYDLREIGNERRGGYSWYGSWGESVFNDYDKWSKTHGK